MIQRIQSVYFFLAGLLPAFLFFVPAVELQQKQGGESAYELTALVLRNLAGEVQSVPYGILLFAGLAVVLPWIALFCYKQCVRQIRLANFHLLTIVVLCISIMAYGYSYAGGLDTQMKLDWGIALPILSYVFGYLARRGVRHDEALIRSTERFR